MRSVLFSLLLTLALAGGASGLAFVAGRAAADAPGSFERGVTEGERVTRVQARAELGPGSPAYRGAVERARRSGFAEGRRAGRAEGAKRTRRAIAPGGFAGGWDVGWYVVALAPTGGGAHDDLGITARVRVRRGVQYGLCPGVSRICEARAGLTRAR